MQMTNYNRILYVYVDMQRTHDDDQHVINQNRI